MWPEISVLCQLSHKSTVGSSPQLQIVTDDHKRLHQSTWVPAVRPTGTDVTDPLLFPSQPEEEKDDFCTQAEKWWATFRTSLQTHRNWESGSAQVPVCVGCKWMQGQKGLGSGFLTKEKLRPSALQWKIFRLQSQGKAWPWETHHSITVWRRPRCCEGRLTPPSKSTCPLGKEIAWWYYSWELPREANEPLNQSLETEINPFTPTPLQGSMGKHRTIPSAGAKCLNTITPTAFLVFLPFVPCSPGSHSPSERCATWKRLSHISNYHQSEKNPGVLERVPSLEHRAH